MTDNVISLNYAVPAIRALVGDDPDDFGLLLTLAAAGEIPVTNTSTGGYLVARKDLQLIVSIFRKYQRT
jgi:hypothetical protein